VIIYIPRRGFYSSKTDSRSRISGEFVELIRILRDDHGFTVREIADKLHVPIGTIRKIIYFQRRPAIIENWQKIEI
jgi:DNA invertase Pin-like site-specific DNA recombinase